jgi:aminoglycoside phosphotransferase (APT) family kinase protein
MINDQFRARVEAHLGRVLGLTGFGVEAIDPIAATNLSRTVVRLATRSLEYGVRDYVMLMDQPSSPVVANRAAEFAAMRAVTNVPGIPVPEACWLEADPAIVGRPFLLTSYMPGVTSARALLDPTYANVAAHIARRSFEMLGHLAAADAAPLASNPAYVAPAPHDVAAIELDRWAAVLSDHGGADALITQAVIRHLRRTLPPPSARLSIVHGDYRLGNYLFDDHDIVGILDWEMVHLGDAHEDLAWALLKNWEFATRPGLPAGHLIREEAITAWEASRGIACDRTSLSWWSLLGHVKAAAIWATSRHLFASGAVTDLIAALVGYASIEQQECYMLETMEQDKK